MEFLHRKQFIALQSGELKLDTERWVIRTNNPWTVYLEHDLLFQEGRSENGKEFLLLGICVNIYGTQTVLEQLRKIRDIESLIDKKNYWSGRWVIFYDGHIFTDASANLNTFYTSAGEKIVSSSLSLIQSVNGNSIDLQKDISFQITGWHPVPGTRLSQVSSLLSYQYLTPLGKAISYSKSSQSHQYSTLNELYGELIKSIKQFIELLAKEHKLCLPLTGGIDSRTILAFLLASNLNFEAYTSNYQKIKLHDTILPWLLSKKFKFKYSYLLPRFKSKSPQYSSNAELYSKHTLGNSIDKDNEFFAGDQYPKGPKVMLRGAGWACFRGYYTNDWAAADNSDLNLEQILKKFPAIEENNVLLNEIKEWLKQTISANLVWDWRMQFYIDQRLSAWDGAIEQSIDLTDLHPVQIINSDYQLSLLWNIKQLENFSGRSNVIQVKIINLVFPKLLHWKFNMFNGISNPVKKWLISQLSFLFKFFIGSKIKSID